MVTVQAGPPVPRTDDPDTAGFWTAAAEHRVAVCSCESCGTTIHPPRSHCFACGGSSTSWRDVAPRAALYSWTVVEQPVHPAFEAPYTAVLVELEDEPEVRLSGFLPGRPALRAAMPMIARFEDHDGYTLIQWWPEDGTDE